MDIEQIKGIVQTWAATQPEITKVWLYGSRVRGTHRPDSDLDVAVQVRGDHTVDEQFAIWMQIGGALQDELNNLLPMTVQVEWYCDEDETYIICRGLRESSLLIYGE